MKNRDILRNIIKNIADWIKVNRLAVMFFLFACVMEMSATFIVEGTFLISRPFIGLGLLLMITALVSLIKKDRVRLLVYAIVLVVHVVVDLIFSVIFDMTEQYFDFGMLSLRNDAFGILESIPVNFFIFYVGFALCVIYVILGMRMTVKKEKRPRGKKGVIWRVSVSVVGAITLCSSCYLYNPKTRNKYEEMLYGTSTGAYSSYGMVGNLLNEFALATALRDRSVLPDQQITDFIYKYNSTPTSKHGKAEGDNVIVILAESLEWFAFLRRSDYPFEMPNMLNISDEKMEELFPNLLQFYDESVVMNNFHSREKTDIAETISIMGCYPTGAYINYDYEYNTLPHTMGNMLKTLDEDIQVTSYHDGWKTFYNRDKAHKALGFDSIESEIGMNKAPFDMYDMEELSDWREDNEGAEKTFEDYYNGKKSERNLDSEMIETCKDLMFPTDKRFYTYITTITMHGMYYKRDNLTKLGYVREILDACYPDLYPDDYDMLDEEAQEEIDDLADEAYDDFSDEEKVLFNYLTTALEFDKAVGCMVADLKAKGIYDNTTIAIFGDHNTYYQGLSCFTKDIEDYDTERFFTDLYRVPFMIRSKNLEHQIVDKFVCTADIMPTLLDLLGIKYYTNLYYGRSVFETKESVLYSRAYATFIGRGVVGRSVNKNLFFYEGQNATEQRDREDYLAYYKQEAIRLVDRIKYCDYIFKQDYFDDDYTTEKTYEDLFKEKLRDLNGV